MKLIFVLVVFMLSVLLAMKCSGQDVDYATEKRLSDKTIFGSYTVEFRADTTTGVAFLYDKSVVCFRVDSVIYRSWFPNVRYNVKTINYYVVEDSARLRFESGKHVVFIPAEIVKQSDYEWKQN